MSEKNNASNEQSAPISVRLWDCNARWFDEFQRIYNTTNAAFNIALMRAQGKGDHEIEQACKKYMKARKK